MKITRTWAMPNKRTFTIKPIKDIIKRYNTSGDWLDPFPYNYLLDALEYLSTFEDNSIDGVLFDPLYFPRQLEQKRSESK